MPSYRDVGIVLRLQKLGEADRIVTILGKDQGKFRASARGVRKTRSKFGARLELFSHVSVQVHMGRTLDVITGVHTLDVFGEKIIGDYARYTVASAIVEVADRLTTDTPDRHVFLLTVGALRGLTGTRDPQLILNAYMLRAMVAVGQGLAIDQCAQCGTPGPHDRLSIPAGGAVCSSCSTPGALRPDPESWVLLESMIDGSWETAEAFSPELHRWTSGLIAAHVQHHLDRPLTTLPLVVRDMGVDSGL